VGAKLEIFFESPKKIAFFFKKKGKMDQFELKRGGVMPLKQTYWYFLSAAQHE